jgi:hypothetical protein
MPDVSLQQESESRLKIDLTPCIRLKSPDGTIRLVKSGEAYRALPGEIVDGVDRTCGSTIALPERPKNPAKQLRDELNEAIGAGAGDWIHTLAKPLAKLVGKEGCSACEARRLATNAYAQLKGKHGQFEAMRIMKELWTMSFTQNPDEVLHKLEGYLE